MIFGRKTLNWKVPKGVEPTEFDRKILNFQNRGFLCPKNELVLNEEQIEGIRRSGVVNTGVLDAVAAAIRPGMTTQEIDDIVYQYTIDHGAIPACLNYEGFPKSVCVSRNEVVCHGIPNTNEVLKEGDIVNVDCTTILDGYYADASRMFIIGETTPEKKRLVDVAKECLDLAIDICKPFTFVGDFGNAIEKHAKANGYSVVRELCGHGVGLKFHMEPEVCHYGKKMSGMLIVPGMVFTIEPMINMGVRNVTFDKKDGWTVRTADLLPSAQWEHTFVMREDGLEILTY